MSTALAPTTDLGAIETALVGGDLARLTQPQRMDYYRSVCDSVGLNPLTQPFEYITLNGKLRLYAKRDATDQLRKLHGVSIISLDKQRLDDLFVVTVSAQDRAGRVDASTGAVTLAGLKGEALANAMMKAETKAKRRVTLSICGLGLLDESEVSDEIAATPAPSIQQPQRLTSAPVVDVALTPKPAEPATVTQPAGVAVIDLERRRAPSGEHFWLVQDDAKKIYFLRESGDGWQALVAAVQALKGTPRRVELLTEQPAGQKYPTIIGIEPAGDAL